MSEAQLLELAEKAFRRIEELFPALKMERNVAESVALGIDIPVQPGLKYAVKLNHRKPDELHFSVENFWLEWFPCSEPSLVADYIAAVSGFLSGKYRVLEHYRGKRCVKAELQAPRKDGGWATVGTSIHLRWPWPWRTWHKEIVNA